MDLVSEINVYIYIYYKGWSSLILLSYFANLFLIILFIAKHYFILFVMSFYY